MFVCLNMHYTAHAWQESKCSFKRSTLTPAMDKSWMFWPVITRPPAFQACGVPESDRQPSSLGLKQTLWNVLMGEELILGLNLSGIPIQP